MSVTLCPRCEEFHKVEPEKELCQDCSFEVLKEYQNRLEQEKEAAA